MRIRSRLARAALLFALAVPTSLTACEGITNPLAPDPGDMMPRQGEYVRSEPLTVPEFDFLWERCKFMLQTDGFGIDGSRTSRDAKEIVSNWKTILAPARYQGKRRRVVIHFEPSGEKWIAAAAVVVQRNEDIDNPLEVARAVWKKDDADNRRAKVLVYRLETGFAPPGDG